MVFYRMRWLSPVAWERRQQEKQRSRNMNITFDEDLENNKYWG